MLLDAAVRQDLIYAIARVIGPDSPFDLIVALMGSREAAARMTSGMSVVRRAGWILDFSLSCETPSVFINLVRTVDPAQELIAAHDLADRLSRDPSLWTACAHDEILWAPQNRPFIDRDHIRSKLAEMLNGNGPSSMLIQAASGHGKRTVAEYIDHLAAGTGAFTAVHLNALQHRPGQALDELQSNLVLGCGLDLDLGFEVMGAEPERLAHNVATRLGDRMLGRATPVWLVANLWSPETLQDDVMAFLDEILRRVNDSADLASSLRVVVLTTEASGLPLTNLPSPEARFLLPDIDEGPVAAWLARAAPGLDDEYYDASTRMIFDRLNQKPHSPETRLLWLSTFCGAFFHKLQPS